MISVQNLRRLLSGNNLLLILFVFVLASCGGSKKTPTKLKTRTKTSVKKTQTKPKEPTRVKVDKKDWRKEQKEKEAAENQVTAEGYIMKDVYNVTMFIPFDVKSSTSDISPISKKFINYYAGVTLALKELEAAGLNLNLKVYDSKENFDYKLEGFNNESADVIIGPYDTERLKKVAAFGKEHKIPVVSPWKASKKITNQNPYYVQLSPNPSDHYKKIADHINENFSPDQVFLISRDNKKDQTLTKYIQRYHQSSSKRDGYNEYTVHEDSLQMGDHAYDSLFVMNRPTVFVIPNYSSKDENYIYNCVRRISTEKEFNQVYVYGMPILLNTDKITYDYYKNLQIRTCGAKFVDRTNPEVINFERHFFSEYNGLPTDDAFEGYDMMKFVGKGLMEYGQHFQKHFLSEDFRSLQTIYNLSGLDPKDEMSLENEPSVEYYQNMHLDIIQYQGNNFKRLR